MEKKPEVYSTHFRERINFVSAELESPPPEDKSYWGFVQEFFSPKSPFPEYPDPFIADLQEQLINPKPEEGHEEPTVTCR